MSRMEVVWRVVRSIYYFVQSNRGVLVVWNVIFGCIPHTHHCLFLRVAHYCSWLSFPTNYNKHSERNPAFMDVKCAKTCGICQMDEFELKFQPQLQCSNAFHSCKEWAENGKWYVTLHLLCKDILKFNLVYPSTQYVLHLFIYDHHHLLLRAAMVSGHPKRGPFKSTLLT